MRSVCALLAFVLPATALAVTDDDLRVYADKVDQLDGVARDIEARVGASGSDQMSDAEARERFEQYVFYRLVGRHEEAAEGLFGLVTTGALKDPNLHRDAEWHLAESLYGMGNVVTAEARFKVIAEDMGHAFRSEAVRKLLDMYAELGRRDDFEALFQKEIVSGKVKPTSAITYTIAKSFYRHQDFDRSTKYFLQILPEQPEYARAQYFLGVIQLRKGQLDGAIPFFTVASEQSIDSPDARRVHDLALLALARIAYEKSEFLEAAINYQKVGGDSDYLDDVLFEQTWSWIKQDRFDEALQSVGIFLLAFPEHRYAGDLRVIEGHLHMGCAQTPQKCPDPLLIQHSGDAYEYALEKYQAIVDDYAPLRDRFEDLQSSDEVVFQHFKNDLAYGGIPDEGLPEFALAMMRSSPAIDRSIRVSDRLASQHRDLENAERMIEAIRAVLSTDNGSGGFEGARLEAIANQGRVAEVQVDLLELERDWLNELGQDVSGVNGQIAVLKSLVDVALGRTMTATEKREAHLSRVSKVRAKVEELEKVVDENVATLKSLNERLPDLKSRERRAAQAQIAVVEEEVKGQQAQLGTLRQELSDVQMPTTEMAGDGTMSAFVKALAEARAMMASNRPRNKVELAVTFDTLQGRMERLQAKYSDILDRMTRVGDTDLVKLRERFEAEVAAVEAERQDHTEQQAKADDLAVKVTREGLTRMAAFFEDSVMNADTGIIDVYWSKKLELAEQGEAIQEERNLIVDELERRFALIRQKVEQ